VVVVVALVVVRLEQLLLFAIIIIIIIMMRKVLAAVVGYTILLVASCQGVSGQQPPSRVIQVGDTFPKDVSLHQGFPPTIIPVSDYIAKYQRVIVVGLPGAFTPT
jgi:hypothetical protein